MPGEIIEEGHVEAVEELLSAGGSCQGIGAGGILQVVKE